MWYILFSSFLFGVGIFYLSLSMFWVLFLSVVFSVGVFYFTKNLFITKSGLSFVFIILFLLVGFFRASIFKPELFHEDPLSSLEGEEVEMSVEVLNSPARKEFSLRAKGGVDQAGAPDVLLVFERDVEVDFGDKLFVCCHFFKFLRFIK